MTEKLVYFETKKKAQKSTLSAGYLLYDGMVKKMEGFIEHLCTVKY